MRNKIRRAGRLAGRAAVVAAALLFVAACAGTDEGPAEAPAREVLRDPGAVTEGDWPVITGNLMGQRYSPLADITAENFNSLGVAWSFDASGFPSVNARATPIYVNGKLISVAGDKRHVYALDAGTGEKLWEYVEPDTPRWEYSMRKNHGKGVAYANVDGRDVGSVAADVQRALEKMKLPLGVSTTLRGPVTTMKTGARSLGIGIAVAAILVYLVMLAQFRSFVDPLIIMLAVPLGVTGVIGILFITNTTINIQSLMGTLMMIGVVVNNSILLVEFANQLRERGYSVHDAAIGAAKVRLRPILMTAGVLIASMLPLSFHLAPGGEAMIPLARALIGGMLVSTVLTLFLVPCVYTLVKRDPPPVPV
jgi:hypothetical protein